MVDGGAVLCNANVLLLMVLMVRKDGFTRLSVFLRLHANTQILLDCVHLITHT